MVNDDVAHTNRRSGKCASGEHKGVDYTASCDKCTKIILAPDLPDQHERLIAGRRASCDHILEGPAEQIPLASLRELQRLCGELPPQLARSSLV